MNEGPVLEAKYPDWLPSFGPEVTAIFNAHNIGSKKCSTIYLCLPNVKVVSFYTGSEYNRAVSLILERGEKPNIYLESLEGLIKEYICNGGDFKYELLPKLYNKLEKISKAQTAIDKIMKWF